MISTAFAFGQRRGVSHMKSGNQVQVCPRFQVFKDGRIGTSHSGLFLLNRTRVTQASLTLSVSKMHGVSMLCELS